MFRNKLAALLGVLLVLLMLSGAAFASSEEGEAAAPGHDEAAAASHEGAAEGGAHHAGWKKTDTYKVMNFSILAAGLVWIFLKVGRPALAARIEGIKKDLDDLAARKEEAKKELALYEERLSGLAAESQRIVAEYIRQGEVARDKILAEAAGAADRLREQARRHMEHEIKEARARLTAEIVGKAMEASEKIIRTNINSDDQERLVAEFLEKVVLQ